jgi:hypothetical protein
MDVDEMLDSLDGRLGRMPVVALLDGRTYEIDDGKVMFGWFVIELGERIEDRRND